MRNMHSSSQATPRPQQQAPQPHLLQRCSEFLFFFYLVLQNSHFLKMGENILPAHNLVVDMFVHLLFLFSAIWSHILLLLCKESNIERHMCSSVHHVIWPFIALSLYMPIMN